MKQSHRFSGTSTTHLSLSHRMAKSEIITSGKIALW